MRFLKKVIAAMDTDAEHKLQQARTAVVERLLKGDKDSVSFKRNLATWRKAWKNFYGFALSPEQEKRFLDVLSNRDADPAEDQPLDKLA